MEDVDLSTRAWRVGWKCYFEPLSVCRHKTSSSIGSKEKKIYVRTIYNRNKMFFHAIHLQGINLFGWYIQTVFELLFRIVTFRFDYFQSFIAFLQQLSSVKISREKLQQLSQTTGTKLSLRSIVRFIQKDCRE